nr:MAG TPA: zinc-ribbon containing domain protein [Caudoviricetes sp.]
MSEYIERKALDKALTAADVAPVVHGHFVHDGPMIAHGVDWWHCSICGRLVTDVESHRFDYCPWCGARMDGDDDAKAD